MKVFVDANIYKYSATRLLRLRPRKQVINWGGEELETVVHDFVTVNPNENIRNNPLLRKEVDLIPEIVALQQKEGIEFCETTESMLETWGLPNMDSRAGWLYGAKITWIDAPIKYSRILLGWNIDAKEAQYQFLLGIDSPRFKEIQKAVGAFQGEKPPNRNQLLDAYHLWCAEHAGCEFFLTGEAKKLRQGMSRKKGFKYNPQVLLPSELLNILDGRLNKKIYRRATRWLRQLKLLPPVI